MRPQESDKVGQRSTILFQMRMALWVSMVVGIVTVTVTFMLLLLQDGHGKPLDATGKLGRMGRHMFGFGRRNDIDQRTRIRLPELFQEFCSIIILSYVACRSRSRRRHGECGGGRASAGRFGRENLESRIHSLFSR